MHAVQTVAQGIDSGAQAAAQHGVDKPLEGQKNQ